MIIKEMDDKEQDILDLENLKNSCSDRKKISLIEEDIRKIKAGIKNEKDAAYEINFYLGKSLNHMIIHDLRIEYADKVAQIDHLIINRTLQICVCESKNYAGGLFINEYGEFSSKYNNKFYNIGSPIEQNNKHIFLLEDLIDKNVFYIPKRLGFKIVPQLINLVLVSKNAYISRPKNSKLDLSPIIKIDNIKDIVVKNFDSQSAVKFLSKVISSETLEEVARSLVALHKPIKMNFAAKYGLKEIEKTSVNIENQDTELSVEQINIDRNEENKQIQIIENEIVEKDEIIDKPKIKQKRICCSCNQSVPFNVFLFCLQHKNKFDGKIYCLDCQKNI